MSAKLYANRDRAESEKFTEAAERYLILSERLLGKTKDELKMAVEGAITRAYSSSKNENELINFMNSTESIAFLQDCKIFGNDYEETRGAIDWLITSM